MPADEVTHGTDVDESRVRTGPRHAAPKKPLFTRLHMPAGKAIATVAMPTAVIMGFGFTSSLALADNGATASPSSKSLTADEYKDCVAALAESTASPSATPSASASESADSSKDEATPSASASKDADSGKTSSGSSDSGSDDDETVTPTPSASASKTTDSSGSSSSTATATPSASESSGSLLDTIGDAITGILTGGSSDSDSTASATPTPTASASASATKDSSTDDSSSVSDTVKDTTKKVTDTVNDTVKDTASKAAEAAEDAATASATATPSPSASESADTSDCPVATDDTSGVDNKVLLPDDPWYLNASSLLLKGADYQGVVEVKTASGKVKKVLKYVISGGTDIGDLHQTVNDKQSGKTYHVQAASGSTSTIRDGDTVMYTESISGNLFGLIPITFDPDNPPPLNIPLIYFTNVKVVQAGQFGGTLTVPGLHSYQN
ncbi:hypothetical protein OG824_20960 [Streptomyces prunicolor]|uniref:hypothetical protein n=1 Tax=Streptomyces prunicolor TaxID=67348 RepID=UPI0022532613|nr:hypothetical protein [Streptomyces prunicolor]MCX5237676.1 hypothetical protein [Streptomyces prunicolor]